MADLNVNSIGDASGGTTATVNGFTPTASNMAGRNRIINGDMRIDQRNAGASVTPSDNAYTLDRWRSGASQSSKYSIQQNAGSVTSPEGFSNYLGVTSLSSYSILASDYFFIRQRIEGFNVADLGWGTANAKTITLSFWVRSSLTGTFGGSVQNSASDRSYPFSYTISSANTWEQKSITIVGDTSGTWGTTNGNGLSLTFGFGVGTDRTGTAGSWAGTNYASATGATSVVGTSGATFYITGVQLEEGSVATPFEHRQYGQELALCQRYAYVPSGTPSYSLAWSAGSLAFIGHAIPHPQLMRATPTISGVTSFVIQGVTASAVGFAYSATASYLLLGGSNSNGQSDGVLRTVNSNQIPIISAEL